MSETGPPGENVIYALLPTIFRQQDIVQGYTLLALTRAFDEVRAKLAAGVDALEADWFIATCPLDYVPLIGGLVGLDIARPVRPEHRALVADALAFRRRKGTAGALPRQLRGASGWYSLFQPGAATPPAAWPLPPVPPLTDGANGVLRVWTLPVFAVVGATPAVATTPLYYHFNPLGLDQPLFNLPSTPLEWAAASPVTALPVPLDGELLSADLARYDAMWSDPATGPADSLFYGPGRGLVIRTSGANGAWTAVPPGSVRAMSLAGQPPVPPDYPVLMGGPVDLDAITATTTNLKISFGDATATLSVDVPAKPGMSELVSLLSKAIAAADVVPGKIVSKADVEALEVGAVGNALVIVAGSKAGEALSIAPTQAGGANPLALAGSARTGLAAATLPLTAPLIALLTGAPANSVMTFTAPAGQVLNVPLPLKPAENTPAGVAAALGAALPGTFVCAAGAQVVIVPPPGPPGQPVPATAPAPGLGLTPAVTIDPVLGQFCWPSGWPAPAGLSVDYGIALSGAMGGIGLRAEPRPTSVPGGTGRLADAGNPAWLATQLAAWAQSKKPCTILDLQGSATRLLASQQLAPKPDQSLWILGAAGSQPAILMSTPGVLKLLGPALPDKDDPHRRPGLVALDGLVLSGSIQIVGGAIDLELASMTLLPVAGSPAVALVPPSPPPTPTPTPTPPPTPTPAPTPTPTPPPAPLSTMRLDHVITGPIDLTGLGGTLAVESSIIATLPVPDDKAQVLTLPVDIPARLTRLTLIGRADVAGPLLAADSLFDGILTCTAQARLTDTYVTDLRQGPGATGSVADEAPSGGGLVRCTTCGKIHMVRLVTTLVRRLTLPADDSLCACATPTPAAPRACAGCTDADCAKTCPLRASGTAYDALDAPPVFMEPNAYPSPNLARLADTNPPALLSGAGNHDVVGAWNLAGPTARRNAFEATLEAAHLPGVTIDRNFG